MDSYSFMFLLVLLHLCYSSSVDYYVKPSLESKCPSDDHLCKMIDEYANNTEDFEINGDIRLLFLAGTHNLTTNLNFSQLDSVQMMPWPANPRTQVKIQLLCNDRTVIDLATKFIITNMSIFGAKRFSSVVLTDPQEELTLYGVNFSETSLAIASWSMTCQLRITDYHTLLLVQDSLIEHSGQTGLYINVSCVSPKMNVTVVNSSVSHNMQSGIIIESDLSTQVFINIIDSIIEGNQLTTSLPGSRGAVGLGIYLMSLSNSVEISGTQFVHNEDLRGQPVVVDVHNVRRLDIYDSEFRNNRGTAIRVTNIDDDYGHGFGFGLNNKIMFINNTSLQGGALALISSQVRFMPGVNITFENNYAEDVGGAIFVESDSTLYDANSPNTDKQCFYSLDPSANCNISFTNNSARKGGDHIYGASIMSYCIVFNNSVRSIQVQQFFNFDKHTVSPVSSNPSRVCVIDQNRPAQNLSESCADVNQIFISRTVFPGQMFNVSAVLVGAEFGAGTGAVYAQFLPSPNSQPELSQSHYWQGVPKLSIIQLNYSVFSNASHEVLVLAATDGTILANGDKNQFPEAVQTYEATGVIPPILLTTPVCINVTLSNCPLGFYLEPKSMGCVCNPKLCSAEDTEGTFSNQGMGLLYLRDNVWVNAYNNGHVTGIIMHQNCPFDYCNINTDRVDLHEPDMQCTMNHNGILCGKCAPGRSLALGSNKCLACSNNNHLALLIFFAAAGFLLVFFIKILNMTVSQGTINGLIFYANILWAYQSIFFSRDENTKLWFLKTFIAWLNLDFGIEICFIQGLTAYTKTWLQFMFPFYVWSIAGGMILLASCSQKMTRLLGNNSIQVLATLFLLSCAKLLRSIITALMPATLYVFADNGEPIANQTQVVWAFDGHLPYGRVPHVFLLIFALLVLLFLWLPYTIVLLFIQPLRSSSEHKCLRWVDKWKPLFDAYTGPLNSMNQFWIGLLLFARFVLLLTFTITYSSSPSTSVLVLVMTILLLFSVLSYTGQVYDDPTNLSVHLFPEKVSFRSILEITFLFNLAVVGGSFLYLDSVTGNSTSAKIIVVNASILLAFLQFNGIVVYHSWCALKSCRESLHKRYRSRNLDDRESAVDIPTTTTVCMDVDEPASIVDNCRYGSMLDREPLLTGSSVAMSEAIADTY